MTQQWFDREMQNPFKRSIAIKLKSESYMVLSLSFFIVILVKKIKLRRRQLHYQNHAVLETCQYVYELWIHLKKNASSILLFLFLKHFRYFSCTDKTTCFSFIRYFSAPIFFFHPPSFFYTCILHHLFMAHMHISYLWSHTQARTLSLNILSSSCLFSLSL